MAYDPAKHLIRVQGNREYLPVAQRLVWFRESHPDWGIETKIEVLDTDAGLAVFSATVTNENGKIMARATKMETARGFPDYIEKAECVPLDTQILTGEGWKTHDQLRTGEPILAYGVETDRLEWVPLLDVRRYSDARVVHLHDGEGFDVVCTPDHKWAVGDTSTRSGGRRECRKLREAQHLTESDVVVVGAVAPSGPLSATPQQAFAMGLLITAGSLRYVGKHVQGYVRPGDPASVAAIREGLAGIPCCGRVASPGGTGGDARWYLPTDYLHDLHDAFHIAHETELPGVVTGLSQEARASMLEAMLLAGGDSEGCFARVLGRGDWVIDLWTALCAMEGSMVCRADIRRTHGGIWMARRSKAGRVQASNVTIEDAGTCDVWCPQTPLGTWVARFSNDVVVVTGNTGSIGRALALCGFGTQFAPELEEGERIVDSPHPTGGRPAASGRIGAAANAAPRPSAARGGEAHAAKAPSEGNGSHVCSEPECGRTMTQGQYEFSVKSFGRALCPQCQKQRKPEPAAAAA